MKRQRRLVARQRRCQVRTTNSHHDQPIAPNTLDRAFRATAPNTIWVADITSIATQEGWLYLIVVLDLFARRVIGWSMQPTLAQGVDIPLHMYGIQAYGGAESEPPISQNERTRYIWMLEQLHVSVRSATGGSSVG